MVLGAAGLALYLWPAFQAPVVVWADGAADMEWAGSGRGIVSPVMSKDRPPKPGWLAFLWSTMSLGPADGAARRIVVTQSVLLWMGIGGAALLVARRLGFAWGVGVYVLLVAFLRLRDASSTVMSEPFAAALALPIAAWLLDSPMTPRGRALLGTALAALFLVRPNCGAVLVLLSAAGYLLARKARAFALVGVVCGAILLPFAIATSRAEGRLGDLASPIFNASRDYTWPPSGVYPPSLEAELTSTVVNWKAVLTHKGVDGRREFLWRLFHGLLGLDYYDPSWSPAYAGLSNVARALSPLLVLAAAAVLLWAPREPGPSARCLGLLLLALLIAQSLVIGALPRFALPLLALLLVYGVVSLRALWQGPGRRALLAAGTFVLFVAAAAREPQILDREWGLIETPGVHLAQRIPRGALPAAGPGTLHVRVAPLALPTAANIELHAGGALLYSSAADTHWGEAAIAVPLPPAVLAESRRRDIILEITSAGTYGPSQFVLFPVIPAHWSAGAVRSPSPSLSPATGISAGGLDWWAHPGSD